MYLLGLTVVISVALITDGQILNSGDPKNVLTTETIVKKHGYPFEKHFVQTVDGYILQLHRIPNPCQSNTPRLHCKVAFLMHCLLCSSSDWCVNGPDDSLVYALFNNGYDVWMGNARGNTYSRNHTKHNPNDDGLFGDEFWNFSWHETGIYDLPAMLDYVLNETGVEQLRYFGHSQGTTNFFVLCSLRPQYNNIFKSAHLLAPVAFLSNSFNIFLKTLGPLVGRSQAIQTLLGRNEFRPSQELMKTIGNVLCTDFSENRVLCENSVFLVAGFTNETVDHTIIPDIMASNPAGGSLNQVLHYVQEYVSGHFRQFDYGAIRNTWIYGSVNPPDYRLENIDVPIYFYHSKADNFATIEDVSKLSNKLTTLVGSYLCPIENFDHLAHIYSPNLFEKLYKYVMRDVASLD